MLINIDYKNVKERSCVQKPSDLTDQIREYFQNVYVDIGNSWNEGNREPYYKDRYIENTVYIMPNEQSIIGKTAIKKFADALPGESKQEFKDVEIWGNSDRANVRGVYNATDPQGNLFDKDKSIDLWHKDGDGNSKVTHAILNSDLTLNAN